MSIPTVNTTTTNDSAADFWTEISLADFNGRTGHAYRAVTVFTVALEHWVEKNGVLLGVVVLSHIDKDYGYVVLGRDGRNRFRAIEAACSYQSIGKARVALQAAMREIAESGVTVFPQDCVQ
jgi:hypothetical protein